MSLVGTGSILGWSASAGVRPANTTDTTKTLDIDSLYAAKANEEEPSATDSSFVTIVEPQTSIAGQASWYGPGFYGHRTANGETFTSNSLTAAHKTLPFGSLVRVVDERSGRAILVRINDRGPYCGGRILDLSAAAAGEIGIRSRGTGSVRLEIFSRKSSEIDNQNGEGYLTFDTNARAVMPHGYSVKVGSFTSLDQAVAQQRKLRDAGYGTAYLTQVRSGKSVSYQIAVGLFNAESSCRSLAAELEDDFGSPEMIRFDHGRPVALDVDVALQ